MTRHYSDDQTTNLDGHILEHGRVCHYSSPSVMRCVCQTAVEKDGYYCECEVQIVLQHENIQYKMHMHTYT